MSRDTIDFTDDVNDFLDPTSDGIFGGLQPTLLSEEVQTSLEIARSLPGMKVERLWFSG